MNKNLFKDLLGKDREEMRKILRSNIKKNFSKKDKTDNGGSSITDNYNFDSTESLTIEKYDTEGNVIDSASKEF